MFNIDYNFVNDNFNGIDKVKIVLGSVVTAAALAFFLFSFLQANADCGNMTGDCDSATSNNDIHRHSDNNNGDKQTISSNNDDNNDKSETNPKDNDPCDYHGLNVCDKSKNGCDSDHFDCLTDLDNGNYCTTGMCPGDDKVNNNQNKDSNKRDGNKSPASNSNVKKFIVKIILEGTANAETRLFQMRVFVYGPNILNKPTLDKPGKILDTSTCGSSCYTEWDFTASKVPLGSEIKACVWNQESGHQACGFGKASSKYGPETIHIRLPSSVSTEVNQDKKEPMLNSNNLRFPATFLWGAATSPYQVEGGITNNDWNYFTSSPDIGNRIYQLTSNSFFYHGKPIQLQPAGNAVDEWNLDYFDKDLDRAKQMGMNALRIGIEWSRVEPENNKWNTDAIEHYRQMIVDMKIRGITPIITLNHFTLPLWVLTPPSQFTKTAMQNILPSPIKDIPLSEPIPTDAYWQSFRGWENPSTVKEFNEYVGRIVSEFKGDVDYWITLNEPVGSYIGLGYLGGIWSPGFFLDGKRAEEVLHNLIEAHVAAYDTISSIDNLDANGDGITKLVGFSHAMTYVKPAKFSILGIPADNTEAAKNFDYFTNDYFLNAVINGEEDVNYLNTLQRQDKSSANFIIHSEWKHKADFIGLNYYRAIYVQDNPIVALSSARFVGGVPLNDLRLEPQPHEKLNDMGWEIYPEGLYNLIIRIASQWSIPVLISENGAPDISGTNREQFIISHLSQVKRAVDSGANIIGYVYWSLVDNYEWQDAYSQDSRFGLYQVNRNSPNFERTPTQAVNTLREIIIQSNGNEISDSVTQEQKQTKSGNTVIPYDGNISKGAISSPGGHTTAQCNAGDMYHRFFNTLHDIILPPKYPDCDYFGKPWGDYGITSDEVINKINDDYNTHGFVDGDAFLRWLRNK